MEAFIGRGRFGADEAAKKRAALGVDDDVRNSDATTRAMAIAVVAQGQRSENLLDFDDDPAPVLPSAANGSSSSGLSGLDFGGIAPAAAVKKPVNTIDDLMGLFDSAGLGPASQPAPTMAAGQPAWNAQPQAGQQQKKSDLDLMGDLF